MPYAKLGFWLGLVLSLTILSWCIWTRTEITNLEVQIMKLEKKIEINTSTLTGYPTSKIDDMYLKINSIDRFIRTTPLVECVGRK